jgi:hypothetical protein
MGMTEEPTMRLFAISMSACRLVDDQPQTTMQSAVGLLVGDADVDLDIMRHAYDTFPVDQGWYEHQAAATEIPQGMFFGPFQLTWQAERQYHADEVEQ